MSRAIQARALEALKNLPLNSGMSAVRALDVAIKIECAILGRTAGEAKAGPTLAALIAASWRAPPLPERAPDAPIPPPAPKTNGHGALPPGEH